jgi:hypothetical protein
MLQTVGLILCTFWAVLVIIFLLDKICLVFSYFVHQEKLDRENISDEFKNGTFEHFEKLFNKVDPNDWRLSDDGSDLIGCIRKHAAYVRLSKTAFKFDRYFMVLGFFDYIKARKLIKEKIIYCKAVRNEDNINSWNKLIE